MRFFRPFSDERLTGSCIYCGGPSETRDHVPPRVFLDEPYPTNLPVVECCRRCNEAASLDEEYVACMIEAAGCGSSNPAALNRQKIARILEEKPALASLIEQAIMVNGEKVTIALNHERLSRVFAKIARGLGAFETADVASEVVSLQYVPIRDLDPEVSKRYFQQAAPELLPEIGSRMMQRVLVAEEQRVINSWEELQQGQFTYSVEVIGSHTRIKFVVGDFLAVEAKLTAAT